MHAMCFGYLDGGADEEIALRRSVEAYKDVELRHAVLHGVGHGEVDVRRRRPLASSARVGGRPAVG